VKFNAKQGAFVGYLETGLWKNTLGTSSVYNDAEAISNLRSAYSTFRTRVAALTSKISFSLPNLTVHDITHLDTLWETADLIAGEDYPFNPAEAFVLGGAILLHDSALSFEAYTDGQAGLRRSVEWRDAFAAISAKDGLSEQDIIAQADFSAMRTLHATRAAELALVSWRTPEGDDLYLIENHELRSRYGQLIGQIAASHHWPIEDVQSKLPPQVNALPNFPREWRVDPVKIACLLRCADAAHIDNRRAPDFLRALSTLHGISADHWKAQNWLERVDVDASDTDRRSLIFTSGRQFAEGDAEAWWVAFDAIKLVDRELASSAALLRSRPQCQSSPAFKMQKVTGATSPEVAARSIRTVGWTPKAVEIHVSNLESLISQIGGAKLYGEEQSISVALREIIQNARDAVVARQALEPEFVGLIRVRETFQGHRHILAVEDNGIGMSERVATGPLLDFGASFWASDLARVEFPGLTSSGYKSVGRFGIGFYSIFMVATAACVSSRRFDAGLDRVTQVRFPNGLSLRPIITHGPPANFGSGHSTIVSLALRTECGDPSSLLVSKGRRGYEPEQRVSLLHGLAIICAGLDVTVELVDRVGTATTVHRPLRELKDIASRTAWLRDLTGITEDHESYSTLVEHVSRLRPIINGNKILGLAALSTTNRRQRSGWTTISTVGGLTANITASDFSKFLGVIDFQPNSAKREPSANPSAGRASLEAWADEQKSLLPPFAENSLDWCCATYNLADLSLDPIDIATFLIRNGESIAVTTLDQTVDLIATQGVAFYKSAMLDHVET
jgi:hypothetical protein